MKSADEVIREQVEVVENFLAELHENGFSYSFRNKKKRVVVYHSCGEKIGEFSTFELYEIRQGMIYHSGICPKRPY